MPSKQILQAAKIACAQRGMKTVFDEVLANYVDPVSALAMMVESDSYDEQYPWYGDVPGMQQWVDDRPLAKLRAEAMTIVNHDFANGLEIFKNDIMDDKLNKIMDRVRSLADKAKLFTSYELGRMLLNGFSALAGLVPYSDGKSWDDEFFFSAAHTVGDGSAFSNTGTAALAHDSFNAAYVVMSSYVDENDKYPVDVVPTHLVCGPSLRRTAHEIITNPNRAITGTATDVALGNAYSGSVDKIITNTLTGSYANYWFLCDLKHPQKPLIQQNREPITFSSLTDGEQAFMRKKLLYGADGRFGFGYGEPRYCWGSNGTT